MDVLDAQYLAGAFDTAALPGTSFAEVAFAGRSNVGKSSLINSLLQRNKLVRTSSTPGSTRGVQLFRVTLRDAIFDIADLPGYGFAKRSVKERVAWGKLIESFLVERTSLRAVVLLVDVRRGVQEEDRMLIDFLEHHGRPAILVATKIDKLPKNQRVPALAEIGKVAKNLPKAGPVVGYSSETGEGRDALWRQLTRVCDLGVAPDQSGA